MIYLLPFVIASYFYTRNRWSKSSRKAACAENERREEKLSRLKTVSLVRKLPNTAQSLSTHAATRVENLPRITTKEEKARGRRNRRSSGSREANNEQFAAAASSTSHLHHHGEWVWVCVCSVCVCELCSLFWFEHFIAFTLMRFGNEISSVKQFPNDLCTCLPAFPHSYTPLLASRTWPWALFPLGYLDCTPVLPEF